VNLSRSLQQLRGNGFGSLLFRSISALFLVQVGGMGLVFLAHVLLARAMGAEAYGVYAYVLAWLGMLLLAAYASREDWASLRGFFRFGRFSALLMSSALGLVLALVLWLVRERLPPPLVTAFWVGCFLLPLNAALAIQGAYLQALKRAVHAHSLQSLLRPILLMSGLALLLAASVEVGAILGLLVNIAAAAITLAVSAGLLHRAVPKETWNVAPVQERRVWISTAIPLFLIAGAQLLLLQSDVLMLGAIAGTEPAGLYAVASRMATWVTFGINAANVIAAPMISELHSKGRMADLQRMADLTSRGVVAFAVPVVLILVLAGKWILGLFGAEFEAAYPALVVLALCNLLIALNGPGGFLMTMTGNQRIAAWVIGGCAVLGIALNAVLIPIWGMVGAATATTIAYGLRTVLLGYLVRRLVGIRTGFL
jgi:O-antigen/teichoic acid export membrane protein